MAAPNVLHEPLASVRAWESIDPVSLAWLLNSVERLLDFLAIMAAVYSAHLIHRAWGAGRQVEYPSSALLLSAAGFSLLFVFLLERHGSYRPCVSLLAIRETERVLRVTLQSFLLALVTLYLCAMPVSRLMFLAALVMVPAFLTLEKWEMHRLVRALRSKGIGTRRALVLGTGATGKRIYSALLRSPKLGLEPVALVDDLPESSSKEIYESSYTRRRSAKVVAGPLCPELFRQLDASVLVIASSEMSRESILQTAANSSAAGINTYFVAKDFFEPGYWIDYAELDGAMLAHLSKGRTHWLYDVGKRSLDVIMSAGLLAIAAPLFVLIAALVGSTSPGPMFFRQQRVGQGGARFTMYKFRTMYKDVPNYGYSPRAGEDPRITRVGHFLRRTSLDELPQLINVFLGQMSLVGPRPEMPFIVEQYSALQRQRLAVKPGMTGLWQLSADRAFLIHENMEYDLYYLSNNPRFLWDIALQFSGLRKFELGQM